jgi:hypothetical protein
MGSEIWALVGVVVGALIAGALQIFAGSLQRKHDRRAGMASKRYDTYMHALEGAARIELLASDLFGLMAHPHDLADEATRRRAFNAIRSEVMANYRMHWVLSSNQVRDELFEFTLATPGVDCERPDGSWDAELAEERLDRLLQAITSLTLAVKRDLQVDELLGSC